MSGEVIDSPTVNSYVVGVSIVEGEVTPGPTKKAGKVTPTDPNPVPEPQPDPAPEKPAKK